MDEADSGKAVAWSQLAHVGAHAGSTDLRPELAELDLDIVRQAFNTAWIYSRADFEPHLDVALTKSQWRETCALAGSMAESLMLSSATYTEAVWHRRLIETGAEPPGMAIAQRYLADNTVDTAVSVGHRLINFLVRVARTEPSTRELLGAASRYEKLGPSYEPFSTGHSRAWLSLNKDELKHLRRILPAVHRPALDHLEGLVKSSEWQALVYIRSENFHRWRKEHESVIGVDATSGNGRDIFDHEGNVTGRSVGGHSRRHTAGDGLTEKTTAAAGDGIRVIAETLKSIIEETLAVLPTITGGFTVEHDGKRLKQSWKISGPQSTGPAGPQEDADG